MPTQKYKKSNSYKTKKQFIVFSLANDIFKNINVNKIDLQNNKEFYWIISKKYNNILDNGKYQIVHFLLYCLMRFTEWEYKSIIEKYITFPINFPISVKFNTKYTKYNSFNSLLYLNNFIYHLLEINQTLETFIKESSNDRWGYNVSIVNINNKSYYNIYYVINTKKLEIAKILFSNNYHILTVNNYIDKLKKFIKNNKNQFIDKKYLTSILNFNLEHKLNYKNKYIISNELYIPKCHLELNKNYDDTLITYLLYKEILWHSPERIIKFAEIFKKYRNIEQLKKDLLISQVSYNDFNDMIRSIKPLGFSSQSIYKEFMTDFAKIISTKIKNFIIKIYGSSTLFYSANPTKNSMFSYDESDFDIIIIPTENMEQYIPELDYLVSKTYDINMGLYITPIFCEFFGTNILNPYFKKWGPCSFAKPSDVEFTNINNVDINKTILKRYISPYLSKLSMHYYYDTLTQNKTCLPNFSMFITNGDNISYWDENNQYITNKII